MTTPVGPLDLLKYLGEVPLDPLVDALRQLHERGTIDSKPRHALSRPFIAPPPRPAAAKRVARGSDDAADYEVARRHFVEHSQRLRDQAILAERLLNGLASRATSPPAPLQHELRISCARKGRSGSRFVVVNCLDRAVDVQFRVGRLHGVHGKASVNFLSFDPSAPRLQRGGEQMVNLSLDLSDDLDVGDVVEFGIDVLGDSQLLVKLWVQVDVRREEVACGPTQGN